MKKLNNNKTKMGNTLLEVIETEMNISKDKESGESMYCQWIKHDNNVYIPSIKPNFVQKIPSGYYKINHNNEIGYHLIKKTINSDYLFDLPFDETEVIMGDIDNFWNSKENYNKYKLLHKRGIMLYGPPGSGKSK
jgi:SpoVK/Ycf46/Vps4 family AAA+-type ATPase